MNALLLLQPISQFLSIQALATPAWGASGPRITMLVFLTLATLSSIIAGAALALRTLEKYIGRAIRILIIALSAHAVFAAAAGVAVIFGPAEDLADAAGFSLAASALAAALACLKYLDFRRRTHHINAAHFGELYASERQLVLSTQAMFAYTAAIALLYCALEGWQPADAVYWASMTLSTVGNAAPSNVR